MNPSPKSNELVAVGAHLKGFVAVCMLWLRRSHQLTPPAVDAVRGRPRAWLRCGNAPASAARRGLALAGAARDSGEGCPPAPPLFHRRGWCRRRVALSLARSGGKEKRERGRRVRLGFRESRAAACFARLLARSGSWALSAW
jgi:hypothetical protein